MFYGFRTILISKYENFCVIFQVVSTHYVWTNGEGYMWGTQSTHKSIEGRRKKRCVAVKCFEGSGRYRRWLERISTLVVCKTSYRSEYNKVDSQSSLSHLFGKAYIPNRKWARSEKIVQWICFMLDDIAVVHAEILLYKLL